jgi:translation initiation factor 1
MALTLPSNKSKQRLPMNHQEKTVENKGEELETRVDDTTNPADAVEDSSEDHENWSPSSCKLYVSLDRKQRAGKPVTFIEDFNGPASELLQLGKTLKVLCGVGGSVKDGCILIQGDHRDRMASVVDAGPVHIAGPLKVAQRILAN